MTTHGRKRQEILTVPRNTLPKNHPSKRTPPLAPSFPVRFFFFLGSHGLIFLREGGRGRDICSCWYLGGDYLLVFALGGGKDSWGDFSGVLIVRVRRVWIEGKLRVSWGIRWLYWCCFWGFSCGFVCIYIHYPPPFSDYFVRRPLFLEWERVFSILFGCHGLFKDGFFVSISRWPVYWVFASDLAVLRAPSMILPAYRVLIWDEHA